MAATIPQPPGFGEPAPLFTAETDGIPNYSFHVVGGHWIVLMFFGSLSRPPARLAHTAALARAALFNDTDALYFGVSFDMADRIQHGLVNAAVGIRYFWDYDLAVHRLYGLAEDGERKPAVFLIDPNLRIVMSSPIEQADRVLDALERQLAAEAAAAEPPFAPILVLPRVFEPALCAELVEHFQRAGGRASGFAQDVEGQTLTVVNNRLKRRTDVIVEDPSLVDRLHQVLQHRLLPMVQRAFGWQATHIERYLVSAYSADESGFFSAHRDDTMLGTAHRKFAVSINLNTGAYEGGDLGFPEFGRRRYRPALGGAVVFGCNLLHEVMPVTAGIRYAFLPFLYDEQGARLRKANLGKVAGGGANRQQRRQATKLRP